MFTLEAVRNAISRRDNMTLQQSQEIRDYADQTESLRKEGMELYTKEKEIFTNPKFKGLVARAAYGKNWKDAGYTDRGDLPGTQWKYQSDLSDDRRAVWFNPTLRYVIISYRGTNFSGDGKTVDLLTDGGIFGNFTSLTPMYQEDEKHFKRVKARFPDAYVELVGHSLGGHRARIMGTKQKVPSFGFNEGASPIEGLSGLNLLHRADCFFNPKSEACQHKAFRVAGDPLSISSYLTSPVETLRGPSGEWGVLGEGNAHTEAFQSIFQPDFHQMICNEDRSFCI